MPLCFICLLVLGYVAFHYGVSGYNYGISWESSVCIGKGWKYQPLRTFWCWKTKLLFSGSQFVSFSNDILSVAILVGSGMTLKLSPAILQLIEHCMREDDETTATQLQARLAVFNVHVSLTTILAKWDGYIGVWLIVNWSETRTNKSGWSGLKEIFMKILMTSFGVMRQVFSWIVPISVVLPYPFQDIPSLPAQQAPAAVGC